MCAGVCTCLGDVRSLLFLVLQVSPPKVQNAPLAQHNRHQIRVSQQPSPPAQVRAHQSRPQQPSPPAQARAQQARAQLPQNRVICKYPQVPRSEQLIGCSPEHILDSGILTNTCRPLAQSVMSIPHTIVWYSVNSLLWSRVRSDTSAARASIIGRHGAAGAPGAGATSADRASASPRGARRTGERTQQSRYAV